MSRILLFVIISVFSGLSVSSQDKDISILKKLNDEWLQSYVTKDTATLNRIFADDFLLINHRGIKMTKKQIVSNLASQETKSIVVDSSDIKLLTPDVGIVIVYSSFVLISDGKEVKGRNCYQDVYIKRRRQWYAVSAHVTLLSLQ